MKSVLVMLFLGFGVGVSQQAAWGASFVPGAMPDFELPPRFDQKTDKEYWDDVDLKFAKIREFLTHKRCTSKKIKFIACFKSFNSILASLKKMQRIVSTKGFKKNPTQGELKKEMGLVSFVIIKSKKIKTIHEYYKQLEQVRKTINEDLENLFEKWMADPAKEIKPKQKANKNATLSITSEKEFSQILNLIQELIGDAKNDQTNYSESQVVGLALGKYLSVSMKDPHLRIEPKERWNDFRNGNNRNNYFGIGTYLKIKDSRIYISPFPGSSAEKAGLKINDEITHVDGKDLKDFNPGGSDFKGELKDAKKFKTTEAVKRIKGKIGTTVKLMIKRGKAEFEVEVTRYPVLVPNILTHHTGTLDPEVGYFRIGGFDSKTCTESEEQLDTFVNAGKTRVIIDLRNNGGGLLNAATCLVDLFVEAPGIFGKNKLIVQEKKVDGFGKIIRSHYVRTKAKFSKFDLIVLTNSGSASASEIVSGALQFYKKGFILGTRTFGKGSVQAISQGLLPKTVFIHTVARFYLPGGPLGTWTNQMVGVAPDFEFYYKPNPTEDEKFEPRMENEFEKAFTSLGKPFRPEMTSKKKNIAKCAAHLGRAEKEFDKTKELAFPADYQLLVANDYLNCMAE